jgi:predicted HTH domain antitoxin
MDKQISVKYPQELAFSLKMEDSEFEKEIKKISLVKLYELGKISSGFAANLLNINRIEFLEILSDYKISIFPESVEEDLDSDYKNA